jgi:hypothetical protein
MWAARNLQSRNPTEWQLKEFAIAKRGISRRAADAAAPAWKRGRSHRDFFVLKTTVAAANRTLQRSELEVSQFDEPRLVAGCSDYPSSSQQGVVLGLQRNVSGAREPERNALPIFPFPHGAVSLVDLTLDPTAHPESDCFSFLFSRVAFDQLADDHGADRIVELALAPGVAANDRADPIGLRRAAVHYPMLKKSKIAGLRKSRERRILVISAAARLCRTSTGVGSRFCVNRCGPSHRSA